MLKSWWTVQRERRLLGWSADDSSGDWSAPSNPDGPHGARSSGSIVGFLGLMVADLFLSFAWAWGMHHAYAASGDRPGPNAVIYIAGRFLFARLTDLAGGASTNPLTALLQASSTSGGCYGVLATILFRVPAQMAGSVIGIQMFAKACPQYKPGPFLETDIYMGAVVQGILAFVMAMVGINITRMAFFPQTFISTVTRMVLNQIGDGATNGWLNPASAFGWAYFDGTHTTKEHIIVYWITPVLATLLGVQLHESFIQEEGSENRRKSD